MVFPTTTQEHDFDYEATLHRVSRIEDQLTSSINSINLLRAQIKKEESLLVEDEEEVEHLQESTKSNEALRTTTSRSSKLYRST